MANKIFQQRAPPSNSLNFFTNMINEELENYTEDGSSTLNNGESYGSDLGYEDDDDFVRYRKDMIFQNIDFTKHKTKIGATIG